MTTKKSATSTKKAPAKKPAAKSTIKSTAKKTAVSRDNFRSHIIVALIALCAVEAISIPFFIHAFVKSETPALEAPATGDVEIITDQNVEGEPSEEDAAADTEEVEAAATPSPAPEDKTPVKKPATTQATQTIPATTPTKKPATTKQPAKKPAVEEEDEEDNDDEDYLEHENRPGYEVDEGPANAEPEE